MSLSNYFASSRFTPPFNIHPGKWFYVADGVQADVLHTNRRRFQTAATTILIVNEFGLEWAMETSSLSTDLAKRFPENPILVPGDVRPSHPGLEIECLLNPGVFYFEDKTWLLLRVAERPKQRQGYTSFPVLEQGHPRILEFENSDPLLNLNDPRILEHNGIQYLTTLSHLRLVSSEDGIHFTESAGNAPIFGSGEHESYGIEDCRVAKIADKFYLTYTAVSASGVGVGMRSTQDWVHFQEFGMILPPHNKDCALFEEKVGGNYYMFHRPSSVFVGGNYIWLAESPDLIHWGRHRCIAKTRPGSWDSGRVGAGGSPIRTEHGWLAIYHGADPEHRYCLGALLMDLQEPWKVIARSKDPIMEPLEPYEQEGFFGKVVFTNGHLVEGDKITVYYGASDSVICGAHFSLSEILESLL